jgi:DNA repair exonuclease SbcCD ATPase subunit
VGGSERDENRHLDEDMEDIDKGIEEAVRKMTEKPPAGGEPAKPPAKAPAKGAAKPAPSAKPAAEPAKPEAGKPAAEPKKDDVKDEEVDKIEDPKNLSPQNKENIAKLRQIAKFRGAEIDKAQKVYNEVKAERDRLKADLEAFQKGMKLPEPIDKELNDLRALRAKYDIQHDPQFVEKFDKRIEAIDNDVFTLLERGQLSKENLDAVKKMGLSAVPATFWRSGDDEAPGVFDALEKGTPEERNLASLLQAKLNERNLVNFDKDKAVTEASKNHQSYYEEKQKAMMDGFQQEQQQIQGMVRDLLQRPEAAFAMPVQIPADATPEQKAEMEAHNAHVAKVHQAFNEALYPTTPQARANVAITAAIAIEQQRIIQGLQKNLADQTAEVEAVRAEMAKIKGAGRTLPKEGAPPVKQSKAPLADLLKMSVEDGAEAAMREAGL